MMVHMEHADTVRLYIDLFNARKFTQMGELFAEESLWESPTPTPGTRGRSAIIARYSAMADAGIDIMMTITNLYQQGNVVIAEIVTSTNEGPVGRVADVFEIDDEGRILRMTAYAGPPRL
jgi:ketosteroid isomerase-like protein